MYKNVILICFIALFFTACDKRKGQTVINGQIKGVLENNNEAVFFDLNNSSIDDYKSSKINEKGQFSDTVLVENYGYYVFEYAGKSFLIYLEPNKKFSFSFDYNNFEKTLRFDGELKQENYFLRSFQDFSNKELMSNFQKNFLLQEKDFIKLIDSTERKFLSYIDKHRDTLDVKFVGLEKDKIYYSMACYRYVYPQMHVASNKIMKSSDVVYKPSSSYYDFEKKLDLNDIKAVKSNSEYRQMLIYRYMRFAEDRINQNPNTMPIKYIAEVMEEQKANAEVLNHILYSIGTSFISLDTSKSVLDTVSLYIKSPEYKEKIKQKRQSIIKAIKEQVGEAGKSALGGPTDTFNLGDYELLDLSGKKKNLVEQFRGKYVFVDFWATWCKPCIAEMPHLREAVKRYKGKNIVFVSISLDDKKDQWKKMASSLDWPQYIVEKDWDSYIIKKLKIGAIPHFILFDTKGNILKNSAKSPSENGFDAFIDSHIL